MAKDTAANKKTDLAKYLELQRDRRRKINASVIIDSSHVSPFRWIKNGFVCFYCDEKYTDPRKLRKHTKAFHFNESVVSFVKKVKKHDFVNVDITDLECKECPKKLNDVDELRNHLINAHDKKIDSEIKDGLITFKFDSDMFYCHVCNTQFHAFITLNNHMNSHFQNHVCPTCGKAFATSRRLQSHVNSHVVGNFPCTFCDETFTSKAAKINHVIRFHKKSREFKCQQCPEVFKSYLDRNKHRRNVHNETSLEFKCPWCPKVFPLSAKRTCHVKQVHMCERNHACDLCEWKFFSKYELRAHMLKHTGQRSHQCDICKKSYTRKYTLREHMRIHNDNRRKFVCVVCGQSFPYYTTRRSHMKVHHPEMM